MEKQTDFISVKEATEKYPFLSPGTLANLRCQRKGPRFYKLNRKVLYRESDLESWFSAEPVLTHHCIEERG